MAASVLHYGIDHCSRALVLSKHGYSVDICADFDEFFAALERKSNTDAVLVAGSSVVRHGEIITLTRSRSHASLVLFGEPCDSPFDLVVPPMTSPTIWLRQVDLLIEKSRALRASSQALLEDSVQWRRESALLREQSQFVREQSVTEQKKARKLREWLKTRAEG